MRGGDLRSVIFVLFKDDGACLEARTSSYFYLMRLHDRVFSLREEVQQALQLTCVAYVKGEVMKFIIVNIGHLQRS
jgi:hypothetical protein